MNDKIKNINFSYLLWGLVVAYFTMILQESLLIGGGWDLNEHIAFANRIFKEGLLYYSAGDNDLYSPTSPYFPGVGLLAYVLMYFDISILNISYLLLVLACIIGFSYFVSIFYIIRILYPKTDSVKILYILSLIFIISFPSYKQYMLQFKPDTILLLFMNLIFIIVHSVNKINFNKFFLITLILFLSIPMKQTSFFVYLVCFLVILFNNKITRKNKIYFIIFTLAWTIVALLLLFNSIENLYFYTVDIMSKHIYDFSFFISSIKTFVRSNLLFGVFLFIYIVKYLRKDIVMISKNKIKLQYLIISILFAMFSILGALKTGGNSGNLEVGFIVFLPFVLYAMYNFILYVQYKLIKKINVNVLLFILPILLIVFFGIKSINTYSLVVVKHYETLKIIKFIENNFSKNNYFLVNGNTLLYLLAAGFDRISEKSTISHFNNIINYDMSTLLKMIEDKKYNLILLNNKINKEFTSVFTYTNTENYADIKYLTNKNYKYNTKFNLYFYIPKEK